MVCLCCGYILFLALYVEKTFLSSLTNISRFLKNQVIICIWVYFGTLNSVPLIYIFILCLILRYNYCCGDIVALSTTVVAQRMRDYSESWPITLQESPKSLLLSMTLQHERISGKNSPKLKLLWIFIDKSKGERKSSFRNLHKGQRKDVEGTEWSAMWLTLELSVEGKDQSIHSLRLYVLILHVSKAIFWS